MTSWKEQIKLVKNFDYWQKYKISNFLSQILKRTDQKRNECLRELKGKLCKIKYGFEGSISNVDPGPVLTKQLINVYFYDILVLLNHLNNVTRN